MTAKHTPGPWAIYVPKSRSNDSMVYGIDTNNGIKAESVVLFDGGILKKEDARLIAAAPDLLDAAIKFCRKVESGEAKSSKSYAAFKSAIAKATGKSL